MPGGKVREYLKERDGVPRQEPVQAPRHLFGCFVSPDWFRYYILFSKDLTGRLSVLH